MGPVGAHCRIVSDPVAPGVDASVTGDSGARTVEHPVGGDRGAREDADRGVAEGAGIRSVEGPVDVQGRGQAGGAFGQFLVVTGRESTFAGLLGAFDHLAGAEEDTARLALRTA